MSLTMVDFKVMHQMGKGAIDGVAAEKLKVARWSGCYIMHSPPVKAVLHWEYDPTLIPWENSQGMVFLVPLPRHGL